MQFSCHNFSDCIISIGTLQFGSFDAIVPLGYEHCVTIVAGWQKKEKMQHLLSVNSAENRDHQHLLEKFDRISKQNSNSVRNLVTLAAQIVQPQPEDYFGYWSNPEDQMYCAEDTSSCETIKSSPAMFTLSDSELT